jgi:hypothetical protein
VQQISTHPKSFPSLAGSGVIFALALAFYWPAIHNGFIWDDSAMVTGNDLVKMAGGLSYLWFSTVPVDYFPLTYSSFWLEYRIWGPAPLGYHVTNILLHAGSAVLLWRLLARLKIPGAFLAALLFLLHPVNVESVAWVAERKNTLALFFYILSLVWYLIFEEATSPLEGQSSTRDLRGYYALSILCFLFSLLSKPAGVMLPFVFLALAWWQRRKLERRDLLRALPFFALATLMSLVTVWFQNQRAIAGEIIHNRDVWVRLAAAGWALWFYAGKALWPFQLLFVYPNGVSARVKSSPGFR